MINYNLHVLTNFNTYNKELNLNNLTAEELYDEVVKEGKQKCIDDVVYTLTYHGEPDPLSRVKRSDKFVTSDYSVLLKFVTDEIYPVAFKAQDEYSYKVPYRTIGEINNEPKSGVCIDALRKQVDEAKAQALIDAKVRIAEANADNGTAEDISVLRQKDVFGVNKAASLPVVEASSTNGVKINGVEIGGVQNISFFADGQGFTQVSLTMFTAPLS